jgi:TolA-binding protein
MATKKNRLAVSDVVRQETQAANTPPAEPLVPLQLPTNKPAAAPQQPAKADTSKIDELEQELKQSKSREQKLEQELKQARSQLKEQEELIKKNDKLAAELTDAKNTIHQLIETNKAPAPQPPAPTPQSQVMTTKSRAIHPAALQRYPIQPIKTLPTRTSPDVGWMD